LLRYRGGCQGVAMWLLYCSVSLPGHCYAVARVVAKVLRVVARRLLWYPGWLLGYFYAVAKVPGVANVLLCCWNLISSSI